MEHVLLIPLSTVLYVQVTELGLKVWDPHTDRRQWQEMMPILTPSYPASNSSYNVNRSTLRVMQGEFARGFGLVRSVLPT